MSTTRKIPYIVARWHQRGTQKTNVFILAAIDTRGNFWFAAKQNKKTKKRKTLSVSSAICFSFFFCFCFLPVPLSFWLFCLCCGIFPVWNGRLNACLVSPDVCLCFCCFLTCPLSSFLCFSHFPVRNDRRLNACLNKSRSLPQPKQGRPLRGPMMAAAVVVVVVMPTTFHG